MNQESIMVISLLPFMQIQLKKKRYLTNYFACKSADWTWNTNVFLCEHVII